MNLHDMIEEHHRATEISPERTAEIWRRIVESRPEAATLVLDCRPQPKPAPWLSRREKIAFVVHCIACAILVAVVFLLTPGCSFVAEGTGAVGCEDCYRPPHPGPYPSHHPNDIGPSTDEGESSSGGIDPGSTSGDPETDPGSTTDAEGESTGAESSSSSTGEAAGYEPAHCDMTCPAGDALQPSEAQAGGTFPGCYCATPCTADDECGPLEHCEPFFDRCTVWCMSDADCLMLDSPPGSMACTLWWDGPDDFVHFCAYWNEDAP